MSKIVANFLNEKNLDIIRSSIKNKIFLNTGRNIVFSESQIKTILGLMKEYPENHERIITECVKSFLNETPTQKTGVFLIKDPFYTFKTKYKNLRLQSIIFNVAELPPNSFYINLEIPELNFEKWIPCDSGINKISLENTHFGYFEYISVNFKFDDPVEIPFNMVVEIE
jgi:hypothetical protein